MDIDFGILVGRVLSQVDRIGDEEIVFHCANGEKFALCHHQDCCESVFIESVAGSLCDLVGSPITMAEEVTNENEGDRVGEFDENFTWTFYKLATIKGYVDIRFYGTSNGYYSERVSFERRV